MSQEHCRSGRDEDPIVRRILDEIRRGNPELAVLRMKQCRGLPLSPESYTRLLAELLGELSKLDA